MSKPRIFISSTYYDLKHVRSSLENFIEELGYEAILSEKGDIAFAPDTALDESCYREVANSDIYVLIIGGRYGSEKTETRTNIPKEFYARYDSITKQEYLKAVQQDIPIYILIEKAVYVDFETYLRNKGNDKVNYAHVDSVNIFVMIEEILSQMRNNPVHHFDRYSEIEDWLKEQWAGLFRELISRLSSQKQISSLSSQVSELSEVNKTLKTYLEQVVSKIAPEDSARIIQDETTRLRNALQMSVIKSSRLTLHLLANDVPLENIKNAVLNNDSVDGFVVDLFKDYPDNQTLNELLTIHRGPVERDYKKMKEDLQNPEAVTMATGPVKRPIQKKKAQKKALKKTVPAKKRNARQKK